MVQRLWGDLQVDAISAVVTGIGSQPGPNGGDGWQIVGRLSKSKLQANRHYAFIVSGMTDDFRWAGTAPVRGIAQLCLGDTSGLKHPEYRHQVRMNIANGDGTPYFGVPFQFMVLFSSSPSISDPLWGSSWSNAEDLVLWARIFRDGDTANYAASFNVSMLSWLWFDLDTIPSNAQLVEEYYPSRNGGTPAQNPLLNASPTNHFLTANQPGTAGELWLHFVNLLFQPRTTVNGEVPGFVHGHVTDGTFATFTEDLGQLFKWGCAGRGLYSPTGESPVHHFGSFWPLVQPSGTCRIGFRGRDWHNNAGQETLVHRWRYLGLRIQDLPDVSTLRGPNGAPQTLVAAHLSEIGNVFIPHEPPTAQFLTSKRVYLAHGIHAAETNRHSYSWFIQTHLGRQLWMPASFATARYPTEGVPVFAACEHALGADPIDPRYENGFLRIDGEPAPTRHQVDDTSFAQFWPLEDPDVSIPPIGPIGNPIVIVPGREGPAISTMTGPPTPPDGAVEESPERAEVILRGTTGYMRSWPVLTGPRRVWRLTWSALRDAEASSLNTFLVANRVYRYRPPQETADVAVQVLERPQFSTIDPNGPVWNCSQLVAELVFVNP